MYTTTVTQTNPMTLRHQLGQIHTGQSSSWTSDNSNQYQNSLLRPLQSVSGESYRQQYPTIHQPIQYPIVSIGNSGLPVYPSGQLQQVSTVPATTGYGPSLVGGSFNQMYQPQSHQQPQYQPPYNSIHPAPMFKNLTPRISDVQYNRSNSQKNSQSSPGYKNVDVIRSVEYEFYTCLNILLQLDMESKFNTTLFLQYIDQARRLLDGALTIESSKRVFYNTELSSLRTTWNIITSHGGIIHSDVKSKIELSIDRLKSSMQSASRTDLNQQQSYGVVALDTGLDADKRKSFPHSSDSIGSPREEELTKKLASMELELKMAKHNESSCTVKVDAMQPLISDLRTKLHVTGRSDNLNQLSVDDAQDEISQIRSSLQEEERKLDTLLRTVYSHLEQSQSAPSAVKDRVSEATRSILNYASQVREKIQRDDMTLNEQKKQLETAHRNVEMFLGFIENDLQIETRNQDHSLKDYDELFKVVKERIYSMKQQLLRGNANQEELSRMTNELQIAKGQLQKMQETLTEIYQQRDRDVEHNSNDMRQKYFKEFDIKLQQYDDTIRVLKDNITNLENFIRELNGYLDTNINPSEIRAGNNGPINEIASKVNDRINKYVESMNNDMSTLAANYAEREQRLKELYDQKLLAQSIRPMGTDLNISGSQQGSRGFVTYNNDVQNYSTSVREEMVNHPIHPIHQSTRADSSEYNYGTSYQNKPSITTNNILHTPHIDRPLPDPDYVALNMGSESTGSTASRGSAVTTLDGWDANLSTILPSHETSTRAGQRNNPLQSSPQRHYHNRSSNQTDNKETYNEDVDLRNTRDPYAEFEFPIDQRDSKQLSEMKAEENRFDDFDSLDQGGSFLITPPRRSVELPQSTRGRNGKQQTSKKNTMNQDSPAKMSRQTRNAAIESKERTSKLFQEKKV